ncbi:MAG: AmmeMemoRadiSam system protein A [Eubacterium sp.]|nr:AmmeMemoRadiSam system protein A [Eubacterium sp.]
MYLKGIGIASHPPAIVPEVGGGRELLAEKTVRGIRDLALKIAEVKPKTIVLITPHGNVFQDGVAVVYETKIAGDLAEFGAPGVSLEKPCDMGILDEMNRRFAQNDCEAIFLNETSAREFDIERKLDHGCLVPLYFIEKYYRDYKVVHITIGELSLIELFRIGRVVREAIEANGRDAVILCSADLSHCHKDEGPYHCHPMGQVFDTKITEAIESRDYYSILTMSPDIYEPAGQCGLRPMVMALGATDSIKTHARLFSYEAPFGVGYLSAWIDFALEEADPINESLITRYEKDMVKKHKERLQAEDPYTALARKAIDCFVETGRKLDVDQALKEIEDASVAKRLATEPAAVFVSLYKAGELRGCMGTLRPVTENLAQEIVRNAIEAGAYDPRFFPVEPQELYQLEISVDILGEAEIIDDYSDLDPQTYGLIVEKDVRRGVLLPGVRGIDTPEQQIAIAKEKAGIYEADDEGDRLVLQRFPVERHQAQID